jgi:hypothetical protein
MRKKNKISLVLLLIFIGLVFVSCELQEEAIHQHEYNSNLKLYEMKFEELMTNKKFVNSFSKLPISKKNLTTATVGRTVMENDYGFTIANKPAKVIENNGEISYTFLITRDSTDADSFENLVIQTDSSNTTKAVIIKYNLTSPITSSEDNSYSFTYNTKIKPIVYNNTPLSTSSKTIIICYWITTTYCNNTLSGEIGPEHIAGPDCRRTYTRSVYRCTAGDDGTIEDTSIGGEGVSDGGGGGSVTPDSNYDGSDTSIHGNGGNNINTAPVAPEVEELVEDPCENLKKHLSETEGIKLKSPDIYPYLTGQLNQPKEYGFYFKKENGVYSTFQSYNATTNKITIQVGGLFFCTIHTHPYPGSNPMFSWEDVFTLQQCFQRIDPALNDEVSIFLVVKDNYGENQLYAMKIDDFSAFSEFLINDINSTLTSQDLLGLTTDAAILRKTLDIMNAKQHKYDEENTNMNQEVSFLNYFAGCGASLYKANSTLSNWDKLTLSNNSTNPITKTPCN